MKKMTLLCAILCAGQLYGMEPKHKLSAIEKIKIGLVGKDYAEKVKGICDFDYTILEARDSNMKDLCLELKKMLEEEGKTRKDIKDTIDFIYARFENYKKLQMAMHAHDAQR